jgi:hypothetical protein
MLGLRRTFCIVLICLIVLGLPSQVAYADNDPYAPIETFLQAQGYLPHFPRCF